MKLNLNDITFIIVSYQSENIIKNCLDTLPKDSNKIIVENSNNINLKNDLKGKYDNIEVILSKNVGMGAGNNIGLKACKTAYAFILNPDVKFYKDTMTNLSESLNNINDFTLVTPLNDNLNLPNYKKIPVEKNTNNNNILSVESIDGFSMLFNLNKFKDKIFFDENFFLYLENDDLCLRIKQKKESIYVITNSLINHKGGISNNDKLEYLRNWHWMWSKFYFNKKHNGFFIAILKIMLNFIPAIFKYVFYSIIFNTYKKTVYKMRLSGAYNSMIGKKSDYRIEN
tara:strand:+ start:809 stop:1660 length:852 start_codon:yes stop_codon:yes gene_type:complete